MEYPHRGYGSGEEEHHHHHLHHTHHPQQGDLGYAGERYPHRPEAPDAYAPPYSHAPDAYAPHTHTPPAPYSHAPDAYAPHITHTPPAPYGAHTSPGPYATHAPPGPYATHTSSGPFYPHEPASSDAYPSEYVSVHSAPLLPQGQIVRVFCKGNSAFNLAVENNTVVMKPANSQDESQQWIKDSNYGLRVKDNYGHSAFSLVNKKTQKILKHSKEKGQQVLLMPYRPDIKDDDILWSESQDFGEGFMTVRSASDTLLNLTVFEGAKKIRNGSALVLDTWHKGDHQLWKLFAL